MLTAREVRFDYISTAAVKGPIVEFSEKEKDFNARYKEAESYLKGYPMDALRAKKAFICDRDGVIYHGNQLLSGVSKFLDWLRKKHKKFLFLTNSSERSPRKLRERN